MTTSAMSDIQAAIVRLAARQDLAEDEAQRVFHAIMRGEASEGQTGALLALMESKGVSVSELAGAARVMREVSIRVEVDAPNLVDTCGTGGSGAGKLFNVSTAAAFVAAAAGASVAKHGNRRATGMSGSADLLELAGAAIDLDATQIAECIRRVGVGFMFAPTHHSATRHVMPVRRALGIPTLFNRLGPMTNPANPPSQLIGVGQAAWLGSMAAALRELGSQHVLLVHSEGLDEIALDRPTQAVELRAGTIEERTLTATDFDVPTQSMTGLGAADIASSLERVREALAEPESAAGALVRVNAAAAIYVAGVCSDLRQASAMAGAVMASGKALARMQEFVRVSQTLHMADTQ